MKAIPIDNIAKPSNDKHQIKDWPAFSIKKPQITLRQIFHVIADFAQSLYDVVVDLTASVLKAFPWLFTFYLFLPIYVANERLAQMFSENGIALIFSPQANQWIGISFQFALITGALLASLGFMRNHRIFPVSARAHIKEQHS